VVDTKGGYDVFTGARTDLFRNKQKPQELCDDLVELLHEREELIRCPEFERICLKNECLSNNRDLGGRSSSL